MQRIHPHPPLRYNDKQLRRIFPIWLPILYGGACLLLIPWVVLLAYWLPPHYNSRHWDIAWTGFDAFMVLLFALTAGLAVKRSSWTAISASMLTTALLTDAWFDVLTARPGRAQAQAIWEAVGVELPLAVLSFIFAHRVFNYLRHHSQH